MDQKTQTNPESEKSLSGEKKRTTRTSTLARVSKFVGFRLITLFITVVIGVYLTILIANMGGYVDNILKGEIREAIGAQLLYDEGYKQMNTDQKQEYVSKLISLEETRLGLDKPFAIRSVKFLTNSLTLNLGRALKMTSDRGSRLVTEIILDRLPATLLLMGTSNLILFFSAIFIALALSRRYGSIFDKIAVAMSPTSSAPPWFYGIFLILIFAAFFKVLPFGGMVDSPPPETEIDYVFNVLKHLILPASAMIISSISLSVYNWRTFFLIYSSEDYVEMAKAKGLAGRDIERRYILRPTLPTIITNFGLLIIGLWTGAIITETVFQWPGIGRTTFTAIGQFDTPVIVGLTIIYAYLLAITVFLLDFIYALVDPRVKVGNGS